MTGAGTVAGQMTVAAAQAGTMAVARTAPGQMTVPAAVAGLSTAEHAVAGMLPVPAGPSATGGVVPVSVTTGQPDYIAFLYGEHAVAVPVPGMPGWYAITGAG
jgi:hypothetical protein